MKLELENIGIIKKANINIDGLTVIAGENDSGKSTVGKVLYNLVKFTAIASNTRGSIESNDLYKSYFNEYIDKLFKKQISKNGNIKFEYEKINFNFIIKNNFCSDFKLSKNFKNEESKLFRPIFIDTPFIWNIYNTLKTISNLNKQDSFIDEVDFEVSEITKDLYLSLSIKSKKQTNLNLNIKDIIEGEFEESLGEYQFNKNGEKINLINTAMGVKYFGILQVLEKNNHLFENQILILDEPEVHLHPKWQLKLAKVITKLVQNGVKVLINSHSPYMIQALIKYVKDEKLIDKSNFYLTHKDGELVNIENVNEELNKIFELLAEPMNEVYE